MLLRTPFDPKGPFTVGKGFTHQGVAYATGDSFPPKGVQLSLRTLKVMWRARMLHMAPRPATRPARGASPRTTVGG